MEHLVLLQRIPEKLAANPESSSGYLPENMMNVMREFKHLNISDTKSKDVCLRETKTLQRWINFIS